MTTTETYYKQPIADSTELPFDKFPFGNNRVTGVYLCVFFGMSLVWPFIPPKHHVSNWRFPSTFNDYVNGVEEGFIVGIIIILLIVVLYFLSVIRTLIDRKIGYKKLGTFTITKMSFVKGKKVLKFANGSSVTIGRGYDDFDIIDKGQAVEVIKSATNKLISCKIINNP